MKLTECSEVAVTQRRPVEASQLKFTQTAKMNHLLGSGEIGTHIAQLIEIADMRVFPITDKMTNDELFNALYVVVTRIALLQQGERSIGKAEEINKLLTDLWLNIEMVWVRLISDSNVNKQVSALQNSIVELREQTRTYLKSQKRRRRKQARKTGSYTRQ